MAEPPSSPPSEATSSEDALSWYKAQYEMLESELAEFRESSRELEQELEKDIERAEKQERVLQEKADTLRFEVEEWKVSLLGPTRPSRVLTPATHPKAQVQGGQGRGRRRAKRARKGGDDAARLEPLPAAPAARH